MTGSKGPGTGRPGLDPASLGRPPAVAGSFYPDDPDDLAELVDGLLAAARPPGDAVAATPPGRTRRHPGAARRAGLQRLVAAVAWRLAANAAPTTLVLLGTNHRAGWLHGVGVWDAGPWRTPLGAVEVDDGLAAEIVALGPPFTVDRDAHRSEHSLEVQLPFVARAMPGTRIVPLAVSCRPWGARA